MHQQFAGGQNPQAEQRLIKQVQEQLSSQSLNEINNQAAETEQPSVTIVLRDRRRLRWWLVQVLALAQALLEGGRLVREVGPGRRPLERYEFESAEQRDCRHSNGWLL